MGTRIDLLSSNICTVSKMKIGGAYVGRKSILELFGKGEEVWRAGGPAMIGQKKVSGQHTRAHIYT